MSNEKPSEYLVKKGVRNPDFPYRKIVMCPHCERPLIGSATKGKLGKYYPAYHCDKRGHYFRIPKKDFEDTIKKFAMTIKLAPGYSEALETAVLDEWMKREREIQKDKEGVDEKIVKLKSSVKMTVDKMKILNSETALKYLEEDIEKTEQEISELEFEKGKTQTAETVDMKIVMAYVKYYLDNMHYLILEHKDPITRADSFNVLFNDAPTYKEINDGNPELAYAINLNEVFMQSETTSGIEKEQLQKINDGNPETACIIKQNEVFEPYQVNLVTLWDNSLNRP